MSAVSGDKWSSKFAVENLFTIETPEVWGESYWQGPDNYKATFILNLGCAQEFDRVQLVNTHNAEHRDVSTRQFR